jgi:hypothetical protein
MQADCGAHPASYSARSLGRPPPVREPKHSPQSSAEVKNEQNFTSPTSCYLFVVNM